MEERIIRVVGQVMDVPIASVDQASSPDTIPAWDSLRHMNLVMALEEEFGVEFSDNQIVEMMSVQLIGVVVTEAIASQTPRR